MTGINEFADYWRNRDVDPLGLSVCDECASDLDAIARECWHDPAQQLPKSADAEWSGGYVFRISPTSSLIERVNWRCVAAKNTWRWARISDVLLMPPMEKLR
jgi:hypothetical protein